MLIHTSAIECFSGRCSSFSSTTELSQQPPEGWLHFQQQLQQGANALQAEAGQQAMNTALARVQDDIITIQSTTCLPSMFTGKLSTDKAGSLQIVRCSVCHSLLLAAAFNSHLPSCRPCPIPSGPNKSKTSGLLHAKAASAAHKSASQGKGKKKLQSKGSKKPPAGPSRFAVEQTKQIVQQPGFRPAPSDASVELLSRSSDAQPDAKLSKSQPMTDSTSEAQAGTDLTLSGMPPARDPGQRDRNASGTRLAWTYGPHMSRKNPELDAVNDPALPPRFPYNVCRTSKRKSR